MTIETRPRESTVTGALFLSLELGSTRWKLAFATMRGMRPRHREIVARDLTGCGTRSAEPNCDSDCPSMRLSAAVMKRDGMVFGCIAPWCRRASPTSWLTRQALPWIDERDARKPIGWMREHWSSN